MFFIYRLMWRWGELSPRAEDFYQEVYMRSALFVLN